MQKEAHGEQGHLNIYVRDHDYHVTGNGIHARVVVFLPDRTGCCSARVDYKHGLRRPSDDEIVKVVKNPFYEIRGRWKVKSREEYFSNGCTREEVVLIRQQ